MINKLLDYITYHLQATDAHGIHSPYIFELYTEIIDTKEKEYYVFGEIEMLRKKMLTDTRLLKTADYGAGSNVGAKKVRNVAEIARISVAEKSISRLLFRLADFYQPRLMIELGTCLGINTLYLQKAVTKAKVFTFEGCPATAAIAQENFNAAQAQTIQLQIGNIDHTLPAFLSAMSNTKQNSFLDFVYFDANHRYEPTVRYFELCLQHSHEESVFIFDDIHWSAEMHKAWEYIKEHEQVTLTIDLYRLGIVLFRRKQPKQHFILKF
jgi:predicted O-methyltransferase YrrM